MANESASIQEIDLVQTLPNGRIHIRFQDGSEQILGKLSRSELKTAYVLEQNVEQFFRTYPIERIGFLTISFGKEVKSPSSASKRFDSFNTNCLSRTAEDFIKVTQPHKDGRPHYHLLLALKSDIRNGFD